MKYLLITLCLLITGCNNVNRAFDSEISALRDQNKTMLYQCELMKKQNEILANLVKSIQKSEVAK